MKDSKGTHYLLKGTDFIVHSRVFHLKSILFAFHNKGNNYQQQKREVIKDNEL